LSEERNQTIICKKHDKTDCNNYEGLSVLSATYKILYNVLLSRLTAYLREIEMWE